ncbi:hypothetical protein ABT124_42975 [Streptomyces sp. NPDC001982]|uniref:hypothetical protein n=1 Tax=Streptomyces sp. NPDC001982 TaxID=3154405 RepID=UPI00332C0599
MTALPLQMNVGLGEQQEKVGLLRRLAGALRGVGRHAEAGELERAAVVGPVLELAYARLKGLQQLCLDPPRGMTRAQWKDLACQARNARQGVDWLHNHWYLPTEEGLLVEGVLVLLQTAGQKEHSARLVQTAGEILDRTGSHCVAIALAEEDPLEEIGWHGPAAGPGARMARAAATRLVEASLIRGYGDADEQARMGLVEQARDLALKAAAP